MTSPVFLGHSSGRREHSPHTGSSRGRPRPSRPGEVGWRIPCEGRVQDERNLDISLFVTMVKYRAVRNMLFLFALMKIGHPIPVPHPLGSRAPARCGRPGDRQGNRAHPDASWPTATHRASPASGLSPPAVGTRGVRSARHAGPETRGGVQQTGILRVCVHR
jgi:hypothetical protein